MQSLKQRIQPLLTGRLSLSDLPEHDRQALEILCHFRSLEIAESLDPDKIKAELAKVPKPVREMVTVYTRKQYKRLMKER